MTIQTAIIEWRDCAGALQPYSIDFNDVYFNSENGLAETQHVFIAQNNLVERFKNLQKPTFTIAETGFGTGLNFYAVADCWLQHAPKTAKLVYFSIEKLPLSFADMQRAAQHWPQFSSVSSAFLLHYQHLKTGCNHFSMPASRIDIGLQVNDITLALQNTQHLNIDAWLLDGFAPAKNADMWTAEVFAHIARLSHSETTFATFTSAGAVRRGLQAVGFNVQKQAGFGKKREMLRGTFNK